MARHSQTSTRERGQTAETLARDYLQQHGLQLVTRNYHCKMGELDLIMRDAEYLVFVEVRSRRASQHGTPLDTITVNKQRRLVRAAEHYLQHHRIDQACRFDVVGITYHADQVQINWVPNAIQAH
jgi:putative endonuclease